MTAIDKMVCDSSQRRGTPRHAGTKGSARLGQEPGGRHGQGPLLWFPWERLGKLVYAGLV